MFVNHHYGLRKIVGCLLFDIPRMLPLAVSRGRWIEACNRHERMECAPDGRGFLHKAPWSTELHACNVFPWFALLLMRRALRQWPFRLVREPCTSASPDISFIIPHRGKERLMLLRATIESILGQRDAGVECIVVEQSPRRDAEGLPLPVRYIHLPHSGDSEGWRKSWAFNVGVAAASADIVVCHDGDLLVPCDYAAEVLRHIRCDRREVASLLRLDFGLGEKGVAATLSSGRVCTRYPLERVSQNFQGGTIAILREAFLRVGGFDEDFVGWGGEDNEFYDRCRTLNGSWHGYLPFVHLWHAPQRTKDGNSRQGNMTLLREKLGVPAEKRTAELSKRQRDSLVAQRSSGNT